MRTPIQAKIRAHKAAWTAFGDAIETPARDRLSRTEEVAFIDLLATPAAGDEAVRKRRYILAEFRKGNFDAEARHLIALLKAGDAS